MSSVASAAVRLAALAHAVDQVVGEIVDARAGGDDELLITAATEHLLIAVDRLEQAFHELEQYGTVYGMAGRPPLPIAATRAS